MATTPKFIILTIILLACLLGGYMYLLSNREAGTGQGATASTTSGNTITIVAFGDSLTAGYGLPISESYPAQLETALRAQGLPVTVINSGVSGETTKGNLERAAFIRSQNPDIVLLGIGGNDALRALPLADTKKNITDTITTLKAGNTPPVVFLLQMQSPLNAGFAYKREFDALYQTLADENDIELLPFVTTKIFLNSDFVLPDRIHLNKAGYAEVVNLYLSEPVAEQVSTLLSQ